MQEHWAHNLPDEPLTYEEAEEDEVIDDPLEVIRKGQEIRLLETLELIL